MKVVVRELLEALSEPPVLVNPNWDAVTDNSRPFVLHRDASKDGFGANLEREQDDLSICLILFTSRATIESGYHWTPLDSESASTV